MTEHEDSPATRTFQGTQIRDDGTGPMLVAHRHRLVVVDGPDRGTERELESPRLTIGTSSKNDFQLTDSTVSRVHCEISVRDDRYVLRDLASTNGTAVNGTPVMEAILAPGARIRIGETELLFEPKKKWERVAEARHDRFGELAGRTAVMRSVFAMLERVAKTDLSCILVGETGTGKELAARALHDASPRASRPFIVVDCGAISENLVESELFGHEKGAFTGADRQRTGAFEQADGGTIFLDEIGELPLDLQPKLLRALERREVKRLGAARHAEVDVRVIAATHRDLPAMVRDGEFREDLYYRLAEVIVQLPPLRARLEDIELIVQRIIDEHAAKGSRVRGIHPDALRDLHARSWPGNVRELRNVVRRAIAVAAGEIVLPQDLRTLGADPVASIPGAGGGASAAELDVAEGLPIKDARERWLAPMEKEYLTRLLKRTAGDLDRAAQEAGVHRKSLERLLRQHGIKASAGRE